MILVELEKQHNARRLLADISITPHIEMRPMAVKISIDVQNEGRQTRPSSMDVPSTSEDKRSTSQV
jgi:hypothetical protein